jgi:serine/threonine protein kinase/Tol biopolymer transport system component
VALASGTRLGAYEVVSLLGVGGMGEVYKARDTRLDRTVAIKVLPDTLAADPQFRERFEREARAISHLDHAHICTLYDVGQYGGTSYLVLQFLEGETLQTRLEQGALPLEQALQYAIQIADALDKAHRAGIVHRDLKPGNIMLTGRGAVLLDFGLAKAAAPAGVVANLSMLPTTPPNGTAQGTILGTFQYMAPEQLEGREADARTDIFAFGAVVYEMLTGKKAFEGKSQASLISAIMSSAPPAVSVLNPVTPAALDRIVQTCLAKQPEHRWQAIADVRLQLVGIADGSLTDRTVTLAHRSSRDRWTKTLLATVCIVLAIMVSILMAIVLRGSPTGASETQFTIATSAPPGAPDNSLAISPDGRAVAFVAATATGTDALFVRPMGSTVPQLLAGTEGAGNPFWSPDGRSVAFSAGEMLKKIDVTGGPPQTICPMPGRNRAGTWNRDGVIVFASNRILYRVSAEGGQPTPLLKLDPSRQEVYLTAPSFLPDGQHFLYTAWSGQPVNRAEYVGTLNSAATTRLFPTTSKVLYAEPGYLLYERESAVFAQPFDGRRLTLTGEATRLADHVQHLTAGPHAAFSVSQTGVLVYRTESIGRQQLMWFDRTGKNLGPVGEPGTYGGFALSPDGKAVAVTRTVANNADIWIVDLGRNVTTRLTSDAATDDNPVWSPDGRQIAFNSNRKGVFQIFTRKATGLGDDVPVLESHENMRVSDWSRDEKYLVYGSYASAGAINVLPLLGERKPLPIMHSQFNARRGRFSFDGRWLAYESDESGQWQVYAISFPAADEKRQISTNGGTAPEWRSDGRELYYVAPDGKLMAVDINEGVTLSSGVPRALFDTSLRTSQSFLGASGFAVTPDGRRFLVRTSLVEGREPITVVLNWQALLRR